MKKVKILDVPLDVVSKEEALKGIFEALKSTNQRGLRHVATPNPEMLLLTRTHKDFKRALSRAWLSVPDGMGILWASSFQANARGKTPTWRRTLHALCSLASVLLYPPYCKKVFPERVSGVDLMESMCSRSRSGRFGIYLLGAKAGVAKRAKEVLEARYPGISIVGVSDASPCDDDFSSIQSQIAEMRPAILFVAYGAPAQELWIEHHAHELPHVKIAMGVGGAFDLIAGVKKRAPKRIQAAGLEWAWRLMQEPSRIKRIINATIKFPIAIIRK